MKRFLALAILIIMAFVGSHFTTRALAQDDPGSQYVDAYLLIQEGDAAKAKSDWRTAYNKYTAAQTSLHAIKEKAPNWNAHIVEFRLQYCDEQITTIKPNLSVQPPPLAATLIAPPKPPPAPAIDPAELEKLRKELADARAAAEEARKQIESLTKQCQTLTAELQTAKNTHAPTPTPTPIVNTTELDRLRKQIADTEAKAAEIRKQLKASDKQTEELAKQNQSLTAALTEAKNKSAPAPDTAELDKLRAQIDALTKQNHALSTELTAAKNKSAPVPDTAKLDKLRAQIDALTKQNHALSTELTAAKNKPAPVVDNTELNNVRAQLAEAKKQLTDAKAALAKPATVLPTPASNKAEVDKLLAQLTEARAAATELAKQSAAQIADLKKQNNDLAGHLTAARNSAEQNTAQFMELKNNSANLTTKNRDLSEKFASSQEQIRDLQHRLSNADTTGNRGFVFTKPPADSTASMESLKKENLALSEQLGGAKDRIATLHKQLGIDANLADSHIRLLDGEISDLKQQQQALIAKLAAAQRKASEAKSTDVTSATTTTEGNRGYLFRSAATTEGSEEVIRNLRHDNRQISSQLVKANEQIADLQKQLVAKKLAIESNQLNVLRSEVENLQEAKQADELRMRRLREESVLLHQLLNRYATQQPELKRQLEGHPIQQPSR